MKIAPILKNKANPAKPMFDNVDMVKKVLYRFKAHGTFFFQSLKKGVPVTDLLVARFPFILPDAKLPPSMHIELTDSCDLRCVYCNNIHFAHPRNVMQDEVIEAMIARLKNEKISRLCIGGGEATIHPRFLYILEKIKPEVRVLTIVSNGQWRDSAIPEALIRNQVDMIEVSVDAGGKEMYESSRVGSSFEKLLENLSKLKEFKKKYNSNSQINLRLMIRPSNADSVEAEKKFWAPYCDTIMPQYVLKLEDTPYNEDVFTPKLHGSDDFPRCAMPFKNLQVRASGNVFLCMVSGSALIPSRKVLLGNIKDHSFSALWNSNIMVAYRTAHRERDGSKMPICKGCRGS